MAQILVIDDEEAFREGLSETLSDLSHTVKAASSVNEALDLLETSPVDVIFLDFQMPGTNGLAAIPMLKAKSPAPIVIITAYLGGENAIAAMKAGAFDHLTKPIGRKDIESVLANIAKLGPARVSNVKSVPSDCPDLIGKSSAMREIFKMVGRLAAGDSSVLITGETGTGKEVIAKAIHQNSARSKGPFVAVNCAAIPENLLESELFGHVRGAYTGAVSDRKGSFQMAEDGTLFLDEIGDMQPALQAKLLRALQERQITPVGSSKPISINARFLSATHQNLPELVRRNEFREDLYYRLNVVEIHLPALREREGDVALLSEAFVLALGGATRSIAPDAMRKLESHSWPGNIRELRNVIERALLVARGDTVEAEDIRFLAEAREHTTEVLDLPQAVAQLERTMIAQALKRAAGNRSEAARQLGIPRQLLYAKMKEHRIDAPAIN